MASTAIRDRDAKTRLRAREAVVREGRRASRPGSIEAAGPTLPRREPPRR